jgi:hypothetical protein
MKANSEENMFCLSFDDGCEIIEDTSPPVIIEECMELDTNIFSDEPISMQCFPCVAPNTNTQTVSCSASLTSRSEVSSISTGCSGTRSLREIDVNSIKSRLDSQFSDSSLSALDDGPLAYLNGEVNKQIVTRKPYESYIRKKKYEGVITMKERRLKPESIAVAETVKCNCKSHCCLSFSPSDILKFRENIYSMSQKDRKEYFIRDLLKGSARSEDTFDFKYFLNNKQVCPESGVSARGVLAGDSVH